ncbi:MAG: hypothetical protein ABI026_03825 [Gemmatimonadaceae bacterium]
MNDATMTDVPVSVPVSVPVLHVPGSLDSAFTREVLSALDGVPLSNFLARRRWFGSKGDGAVNARFSAVFPLRAGDDRAAALTRVDIELADGRTVAYQLPLIAAAPSAENLNSDATLARMEMPNGAIDAVLVDATTDADFRSWLGDSFERGSSIVSGDARWTAETVLGGDTDGNKTLLDTPTVTQSRVIASEQSNTSIVYGDRAILKLFRRLEPGENPDVEISRFLTTRTEFRNTPLLLGVAHIESSDQPGNESASAVTAMLQSFVAGATDAFEYAMDRASEAIGEDVAAESIPFAEDAYHLGAITRELHAALASVSDDPDFAPRPAGGDTVERWSKGAARSVNSGCDLLARAIEVGVIPRGSEDLARAVLASRHEALARISGIAAAVADDAGMLMRHHGDYHLGQVLRSGDDDFVIIDFEGEPGRPIPERRTRNSALRDVAGMLRSFSYAAAMALPNNERASAAVLKDRRMKWEHEVRSRFLAGYFAKRKAPFLPRDDANADRLLAMFELEKVFYELAYEVNNRPAWIAVPLAGAARSLGVAGADVMS